MNNSNNILKSFKKATSLSETLIALVIAGVVFTICMGTIVSDYNRNEVVVRLKKIYTVFSDAMLASITKNGFPDDWQMYDNLSEKGSNLFFENYLKPNLILARDCKTSTEGQCDFVFKELDGTEKSLNPTWTRFFLNDGAFCAIQAYASENYKVLYLYVDINGKKRLNVVGRDIFMFVYWIRNNEHPEYEGKLLPYGHEFSRTQLISESNANNCNKYKNGSYCSALIMKDNWQIINGYPWAQARYVVR